ncbi:hypothetical protein I6N95_07870 [Vagococcus sp. BWB3-3]|uniref:Uncharacterized protein n=1 Tax=Vagococcus allomyrinae TaxID=2794353 RepID=A0A940SW18_9ENTE|nr:hypothetical protein [Vagococcus allomyrinae]MBP1040918.1 hypothetical protein [Vagococcus allomyrinae]
MKKLGIIIVIDIIFVMLLFNFMPTYKEYDVNNWKLFISQLVILSVILVGYSAHRFLAKTTKSCLRRGFLFSVILSITTIHVLFETI